MTIKPLILALLFVVPVLSGRAQTDKVYKDSLTSFRKNYIDTHELLKTKEERAFLHFFPIDPGYKITCQFEKIDHSEWFPMPTSGSASQMHRKYGKLTFSIHDTTLHLFVYQSQSLLRTNDYREYLFIPFSDITSGEESYGAGRYLECYIKDIQGGKLVLDFNKAYNPYCAYATGYTCPIPPKENDLSVSIRAGEKNYGKKTH